MRGALFDELMGVIEILCEIGCLSSCPSQGDPDLKFLERELEEALHKRNLCDDERELILKALMILEALEEGA
ncbi:hypothetical protein IPA_03460 [Ignicoccus pacificus DSM 13166]|uniref:Uncharacterized protein n=1 Tax=Ignicoccus pacificus DSM 13166 TaxID=940294 RepID=A0A977KCF9_9CREN|nr:hypothetical protein IPA_03460 [Ignicoccus pacificus DSM 13166]